MNSKSNPYEIRVNAQSIGMFETPIAVAEITNGENLLEELENCIYQQMKKDQGLSRSNIGGWHSDSNMLEWAGVPAIKLAETGVNMAKRMTWFKDATAEEFRWTIQMWANVTASGGMNDIHVHPGNLWAAVLYLRMGNEDEKETDVGGNFFIEDPRFPMISMRNTGMRLRGIDGNPQQIQTEFKLRRGNLLVFPAWLRHGVRPYRGDKDRISVAFNIDASPA